MESVKSGALSDERSICTRLGPWILISRPIPSPAINSVSRLTTRPGCHRNHAGRNTTRKGRRTSLNGQSVAEDASIPNAPRRRCRHRVTGVIIGRRDCVSAIFSSVNRGPLL